VDSFERPRGLGKPVGDDIRNSGGDGPWGKGSSDGGPVVAAGGHTEDEKEYLIKAELPDMKKEDV
jgi:hypothetical protein